MTPAEELRAAAERLELLTREADRIYPRMWREVMAAIESDPSNVTQASYIATMHPEVGKALASWLRAEAAEHQAYVEKAIRHSGVRLAIAETRHGHALSVARAINGEAT